MLGRTGQPRAGQDPGVASTHGSLRCPSFGSMLEDLIHLASSIGGHDDGPAHAQGRIEALGIGPRDVFSERAWGGEMADQDHDHDVRTEAGDGAGHPSGETVGQVELHGLEHALSEETKQGAGEECGQEQRAPGEAVGCPRLEFGEKDLEALGQRCSGGAGHQDRERDPDQADRLPPQSPIQAEQQQEPDQTEPDQIQGSRPLEEGFHTAREERNRGRVPRGASVSERGTSAEAGSLSGKSSPSESMTSPVEISRALERFHAMVEGDARLREEFTASRVEFFAPATPPSAGAETRHLEWFFLERPSSALGAVPVLYFTREEGPLRGDVALVKGLLGSISGAFEVTAATDGIGEWVRDLFTLGELPLARAAATAGLQAGDLVLGRLYPSFEGAFSLSPAAFVCRSPELLAALRADLAAMRKARRGVMRIQQLEIERLFHGLAALPGPLEAAHGARDLDRAALRSLGVEDTEASALLARVRRSAEESSGGDVTELLNHLAFETQVDLDRARQILVGAWQREVQAVQGRERPGDVRAALEAFDRGRGEGRDLELLFRELERDLGLDGDTTTEEGLAEVQPAPDFPGVVGAMVDEFLWDMEREYGPDGSRRLGCLRILGAYAPDIGVFEELGRARLLDFTARWLLDETQLARDEVESVLEALVEFCAWTQELHQIPLLVEFEPTLQVLRRSVPRLVGARCAERRSQTDLFATVTRVDGGRMDAAGPAGEVHSLTLPSDEVAAHVHPGDMVRITELGFGGAYPAELRELIRPDGNV